MKFYSTIVAILMSLCFVSMVSAQLGAIEGEWEITGATVSGQEVPSDILSTMKLNIKRTSFDAKSGNSASKGKISKVGKASLKQLLFKINQGADSGREVKAIYKKEKEDLMMIAYSQSEDFPTEFTSTKDNRILVMTYKNTAPPSRYVEHRGKKLQRANLGGFESSTAR